MTDGNQAEEARQLVDQILRSARAHDNKTLLRIDSDPDTLRILEQLPDGETEQARRHLQGVKVWKKQQAGKALLKLDAAQTALDGLDVALARGILRKIDPDVLEAAEIARYDELLLGVEARAVELEQIEERVPVPPGEPEEKKRRRFWRR